MKKHKQFFAETNVCPESRAIKLMAGPYSYYICQNTLNVEILCNPIVKTSNVGFPNISCGGSSKDFLQSIIQKKSSNMVQSPHVLIITNSETG